MSNSNFTTFKWKKSWKKKKKTAAMWKQTNLLQTDGQNIILCCNVATSKFCNIVNEACCVDITVEENGKYRSALRYKIGPYITGPHGQNRLS